MCATKFHLSRQRQTLPSPLCAAGVNYESSSVLAMKRQLRNAQRCHLIRQLNFLGVEHRNVLEFAAIDEAYVNALVTHAGFWPAEQSLNPVVVESDTHREFSQES
jgi:hypothetical protein